MGKAGKTVKHYWPNAGLTCGWELLNLRHQICRIVIDYVSSCCQHMALLVVIQCPVILVCSLQIYQPQCNCNTNHVIREFVKWNSLSQLTCFIWLSMWYSCLYGLLQPRTTLIHHLWRGQNCVGSYSSWEMKQNGCHAPRQTSFNSSVKPRVDGMLFPLLG